MKETLENLFEQISLREGEWKPVYFYNRTDEVRNSTNELYDKVLDATQKISKLLRSKNLTNQIGQKIDQLSADIYGYVEDFYEIMRTNLKWIEYSYQYLLAGDDENEIHSIPDTDSL